MEILHANTFRQGYNDALKLVNYQGKIQASRLGESKEIHPFIMQLNNPSKRVLLTPFRGNDPFATLAETLWVLAGRIDMEWLEKFLPRCKDYSDDKNVWRAGYGKRIFRFGDSISCDGVDQFKYVYEELKRDPESRRAVMTIWNPIEECTIGSSLDFPCTNFCHFMIRDNKLDCELVMRSNDVVFGMGGINVFEFTFMQELLARLLNIEVGKYWHIVSSLHVYEKHYEKLNKIIEEGNKDIFSSELDEIPAYRFANLNFHDYNSLFVDIRNTAQHIYKIWKDIDLRTICTNSQEFLQDMFMTLRLYIACKKHLQGELSHEIFYAIYQNWKKVFPFCDLKVECMFWIEKQLNNIKPHEIHSVIDEANK